MVLVLEAVCCGSSLCHSLLVRGGVRSWSTACCRLLLLLLPLPALLLLPAQYVKTHKTGSSTLAGVFRSISAHYGVTPVRRDLLYTAQRDLFQPGRSDTANHTLVKAAVDLAYEASEVSAVGIVNHLKFRSDLECVVFLEESQALQLCVRVFVCGTEGAGRRILPQHRLLAIQNLTAVTLTFPAPLHPLPTTHFITLLLMPPCLPQSKEGGAAETAGPSVQLCAAPAVTHLLTAVR